MKKHVRMEFVVSRVSGVHQQRLDFFAHIVMAAACFAMMLHGWDFCSRVTGTSGSLEWPSRNLYLAVPAGAALSLVFIAVSNPLATRHPFSGLGAVALGFLLFETCSMPRRGLRST